VRYLTLAEALVIAEAVTGIDHAVLAKAAGVGLLDSALHAPQAGFGNYELYSEFADRAAVLAVRIARNLLSLTATNDWPGAASPCSASSTITTSKSTPTTPSIKCSESPRARSMKSPWPSGCQRA
jgi:death-on-curing protein